MTFKKRIPVVSVLAFAVFYFCTATCHAIPKESMSVTVHAGARQTFRGFGGSVQYWPYFAERHYFTLLPSHLRDSISHRIWGELDFRFMRIWSSPYDVPSRSNADEYYAEFYAPYYNSIIEHAKKFQPNLVVYHTPFSRVWMGERIGNVNTWAAHCAAQVYHFRRHGVQIDYAGIANEPEVHDELNDVTAPILVQRYRRELDRYGLRDIKLVGPETAATDPKARGITQSIINNVDALAALDVFSSHSYNWSITDEMESMVEPLITGEEKEYWQTEAGAGPSVTEQEGNAEQASDVIAKFLADMNHLCNVWLFFMVMEGRGNEWGNYRGFGWMMTAFRNEYDTFDEAFTVLLKYYYFKQASRTFRPGTVFRKATAHANRVSGKYWRREDTTMVFAYGEKAPLYLAAGVNTDGSWAIGVNNHTGFRNDPYSTPRPTVDFEVRITVEELKGRGVIPFAVHRCNDKTGNPSDPHIHPEDTIFMHDGTIVVDSLGRFDFLTLRSPPGIEQVVSVKPATRPHPEVMHNLSIQNRVAEGGTQIRFEIDARHGSITDESVSIVVYDSKGTTVRTLQLGRLSAGRHEFFWDNYSDKGTRLPGGSYFIRLSGTLSAESKRVVLVK